MFRQPSVVAAIIVSVSLIISAVAVCVYLNAIDQHLKELENSFGNPTSVRVSGSGGGDLRLVP